MPGYKPLPTTVTGPEADQVRQAESRSRGGNPEAAVRLLEEALKASLVLRSELPGWLCGRLAALYRTLGRYDDEVRLLEHYRDSQRTEEARTRYDARLSKARTIAERKRRPDSGALASVRAAMGRPHPRRPMRCRDEASDDAAPGFSSDVLDRVTRALASSARSAQKQLGDALALLCAEAHAKEVPLEPLVSALKQAYSAMPPSRRPAEHDTRYDSALLILLALYFKDQAA
jgi:hypothetical protein